MHTTVAISAFLATMGALMPARKPICGTHPDQMQTFLHQRRGTQTACLGTTASSSLCYSHVIAPKSRLRDQHAGQEGQLTPPREKKRALIVHQVLHRHKHVIALAHV